MHLVFGNCVHRSGNAQHLRKPDMLTPVTSVPVDCSLLPVARLAGVALAGLVIVALEAWLRVPVRPLIDGVLQDFQARVAAFFRHVSF
jgi:hypothetical protein